MIEWSLDALRAAGIDEIVVALPPGAERRAGCVGVPGGATRSESVRAALAAPRRRATSSCTTRRGRS